MYPSKYSIITDLAVCSSYCWNPCLINTTLLCDKILWVLVNHKKFSYNFSKTFSDKISDDRIYYIR